MGEEATGWPDHKLTSVLNDEPRMMRRRPKTSKKKIVVSMQDHMSRKPDAQALGREAQIYLTTHSNGPDAGVAAFLTKGEAR